MLSRLHMRLQPRSHAVAGTLPGAACLESLERAGQSDNFELETHWRMLVLGGGAGAGTLAPPPRPTPPHGPNTLRILLTLPTYSTYLLYVLTLPTNSTYLPTLPTYSTSLLPCMCMCMHLLHHLLTHLRCSPYPPYALYPDLTLTLTLSPPLPLPPTPGMFLHADMLRTSSWQMQIRGRKRWHLCPGPGGVQAATWPRSSTCHTSTDHSSTDHA